MLSCLDRRIQAAFGYGQIELYNSIDSHSINSNRVVSGRLKMTITILVCLLALPASLGGSPWEKPPEKWNAADVYRILQDSPWSPAGVKLDLKSAPHQAERQTGVVSDAALTPGVEISRSKEQPEIPVLWWSSKTVRLAQQRALQLSNPALAKTPLHADELSDYVLVITGSEHLRILKDAKEDLHDTVFLELSAGATLELVSVTFVEGTDREEARVEFHFPKLLEGQPAIDHDSQRVILHCKATAKTPRPFANNTLSFRAEFKPSNMQVHGVPDL